MENKMNKTIKVLVLFAALFIAQLYLASALTIRSATSNPSEVQPGEKFTLDLKIENDLNHDIDNVIVSLDLTKIPFAPYKSSNEAQIDRIDKNDDEKADFDLTAFSNAVSGTYLVPVMISYTYNGINGTAVQNESLGVVSVIVNAKPNIVVSSVGNALIKGQSGKITVQIVNSGLGTSNFLSVNLGNVNGISMTSSDNVYIGNINSNDFDTADFDVFVGLDASSIISLPVELTYTDSGNNQITENKIVSIKAYTLQEAKDLGLISGNSNFLIVILVILAVIGFFVYRSIRKRIRNKKNNSH
jgi:hypothetical protein